MSARFAASKTTAVTAAVALFAGITAWIGATASRQSAGDATAPGAPETGAPPPGQRERAVSRTLPGAPSAPRANPVTRTRAS